MLCVFFVLFVGVLIFMKDAKSSKGLPSESVDGQTNAAEIFRFLKTGEDRM